jgi:photosystem II stability/assembly factor-like uncharacterized protein
MRAAPPQTHPEPAPHATHDSRPQFVGVYFLRMLKQSKPTRFLHIASFGTLVFALIIGSFSVALASGSKWVVLAIPGNGGAIASLSCYSTSYCVGVGFNSAQIITSSDGGRSWKPHIVADASPVGFNSIYCLPDSTCYATGYLGKKYPAGAVIYKSPNGGKTWTVVYRKPTPTNPFYLLSSISCPTDLRCVATGATGNTGIVLVTGNGGGSWTPSNIPHQPPQSSINQVACLRNSTCFAVNGAVAAVYRSANSGVTWTQLPQASNLSSLNSTAGMLLSTISCGSTLFCVAGGSAANGHNPIIWYTSNGGQTWTVLSLNHQGFLNEIGAISCTSAKNCTLGVTYGSVYTTTSGGAGFFLDDSAPKSSNGITSLVCVTKHHCLATVQNLGSTSKKGSLWLWG